MPDARPLSTTTAAVDSCTNGESNPTRLVRLPSAGPLCLEPRHSRPEHGHLALFPRGQPIILQHLDSQRRGEVAKPVRSMTARQREALRVFVRSSPNVGFANEEGAIEDRNCKGRAIRKWRAR